MSTIRKKQIFEAMKFRTLKSPKFCSSEIKWVYSNLWQNMKVRPVLFNKTNRMWFYGHIHCNEDFYQQVTKTWPIPIVYGIGRKQIAQEKNGPKCSLTNTFVSLRM